MSDKFRKINVKFYDENKLFDLSKKLIKTNQQLTKNVKELYIMYNSEIKDLNNLSYKLVYKKPVFQKPKEKKEWEYHWKNITPFYITPSKALTSI